MDDAKFNALRKVLTIEDYGILLLSPYSKPVHWDKRLTRNLLVLKLLESDPSSPKVVHTTELGEEVLARLMKGRT